ncbi:MAG: methyltransferase [Candidatus Cloacimonadales bacterium]|jgi:tRNA1Val (adenine37-N6)-methyltransferase|nr:methyltransferase [Candidatus Cloacimonadota bacterium]MDD2650084.1 methyltransferase [Candidatus Cloacimonadota bacterium]MDD3501088.1 methyltransferase [Candidatus Cloacimonadota bacterium]MDX9976743.1 methyltransferase [Candidatus Cloacimonadales bacterium]
MKSVSVPDTDFCFMQIEGSHQVTSDTAFLSDSVIKSYTENNSLKALDLGTGTGIIAFMLKMHFPNWQIDGIDIQETLINLANHNMHLFDKSFDSKRLFFAHQDLKTFTVYDYDLVIANPPYYKINTARLPADNGKAIARHELTLNMEDIISFFNKLTKQSAKLFILYPDFRHKELSSLVKHYKMQITKQLLVPDSKPKNQTFLYEITKC